MYKSLILLISGLVALLSGANAQWVSTGSAKSQPVHVILVSSTPQSTIVRVEVGGFYKDQVPTPKGPAYSIRLDGATPLLEAGAPDL
ncbi:MAG TPA: hypothetical protein P5550_02770, partial [Bacteroidales bacterium]|nr:hypothetical protein [Bacteroidales bacterium]